MYEANNYYTNLHKSPPPQILVNILGPLAPDPPGELDVLGHNGDPLSVDGAQVSVLKQPHQVGFASLLQSPHSSWLEPQVCLEILGNLPHLIRRRIFKPLDETPNQTYQPLERQLPYQKLCRLLVAADLTQSNCSGPKWYQSLTQFNVITMQVPVSVGLLDPSSAGSTLPSCLGCQLLPGGFSSSGLAGSLLCTSHRVC